MRGEGQTSTITSKAQMYSMLKAGAFGNSFPVWETEDELRRAVAGGFDGLAGVRSAGPAGLSYASHMVPERAIEIGRRLHSEHGYPVRYYEASPDHLITIQGEFSEPPGVELQVLEYTTVRAHMRAAMGQEHRVAMGCHARFVLRAALSEASYQDMLLIGEQYPGAVVEFTAYETFVGQLAGRNHVVWEVRTSW